MSTDAPAFSNRAAFGRHLGSLGPFHMDLRLARIQAALTGLGPAKPQAVVQIVGTNGKGSTSAFLSSILRAHGVATGLFTSPHLLSPRERIQVNGRPIRGRLWLDAANAVAAASPGAAAPGDVRELTYFEFLTAMAAHVFAASGVCAAIYEAGLGARHDATSALPRDLVLFAPIGADHEKIIGPEVADIAGDKARAIDHGMIGLTALQTPTVMAVLASRATGVGAALETAWALPDWLADAPLALRGPFQADNAALAVAGFLHLAPLLGLVPDADLIRDGLARAFIPGRFQSVGSDPEVILDAAHNPHALTALTAALAAKDVTPSALVFACMADKNVAAMVPLATALTKGPILLPALPDCPRAMAPAELAALFGPRAKPVASLAGALAALSGTASPVLVCGSLYLLAEFYKLRPRALFGQGEAPPPPGPPPPGGMMPPDPPR
jgi:dihydrofolate synthase/folylpolyglutamate synthase